MNLFVNIVEEIILVLKRLKNEYRRKERRNIYIDLLVDGNAFIYFDGAYLYLVQNILKSKHQ